MTEELDVKLVQISTDHYFTGDGPEPHAEGRSVLVLPRYGKTYFGNERTTFVIDTDGRVASTLRKVKPAEHDELVLGVLAGMARPAA